MKRASKSAYESPAKVLHALLVLDELAGYWSADALDSATFAQACAERNLLYSPDISERARTKHGARYSVTVDGQTRLMGPHLRFGSSWDPRYCARVYWWVHREQRCFIIGHVGEHLPGSAD